MIWKQELTLAQIQKGCEGTLLSHLGIEFVEIGPDYLTAKMPVDNRTVQPFGFLHGGASVALAESIASFGAQLCLEDPTSQHAFGLEINANHIRSMRNGFVYGTGRPIHIGRSTQVWQIELKDEAERLICVSRLTVAVVTRNER